MSTIRELIKRLNNEPSEYIIWGSWEEPKLSAMTDDLVNLKEPDAYVYLSEDERAKGWLFRKFFKNYFLMRREIKDGIEYEFYRISNLDADVLFD